MSVNWTKQAPSWARWIAQDADGTWWAYEHEPNQFHKGWYENEVGLSIRLGSGEPNSNWKDMLKAVKH